MKIINDPNSGNSILIGSIGGKGSDLNVRVIHLSTLMCPVFSLLLCLLMLCFPSRTPPALFIIRIRIGSGCDCKID